MARVYEEANEWDKAKAEELFDQTLKKSPNDFCHWVNHQQATSVLSHDATVSNAEVFVLRPG